MQPKKSTLLLSKDILFTLVCFGIIALASFHLHREITSRISYSGSSRVGTITFKRNTAQRQYAGYVIWEILDRTSPVYNLDTIRTSRDSDAHLLLDGEVDIALAEESLIVVNTTPQGFDIEFTGGTINSVATRRLTIRYKDTRIVIQEGTDFSLKEMDGGDVRLTVNDGEATLDNRNDITVVESDNYAIIQDQRITVSELVYRNRRPSDTAVIVGNTARKRIGFSWDTERTGVSLVVAKDRDFTSTVHNAVTGPASIPLEDGRYYWKLVSDTDESEVFAVTILDEPVPIILTPSDNEMITTYTGNSRFEVGWLNRGSADSYTIFIYEDGSGTPVRETSTLNNSMLVEGLPEGTYQIRIQANFSFAGETPDMLSEPVTVHIETSSTLAKPVITSPARHAELSETIVREEGVTVFWKGGREVESYTAAIYSDRSQTSAVQRARTQNTSVHFSSALSPGTYFASVTPHLGSLTGEPSVHEFRVSETRGPAITHPGENSTFQAGSTVTFSWNDPQHLFSYRLDVSTDNTFSDVHASARSRLLSATVKLDNKGVYYARVAVTDRDGKDLLKGPPLKFSVAGTLPEPSFRDQYRYNEINISTADHFATGWDAVSGATDYRLTLYRIEQGLRETEIFTTETSYTHTEMSTFRNLKRGRYCFQLTALELRDGLLVSSSPTRRHYFDVLKNQELKLLTPSEIFIRVD